LEQEGLADRYVCCEGKAVNGLSGRSTCRGLTSNAQFLVLKKRSQGIFPGMGWDGMGWVGLGWPHRPEPQTWDD